ncbi:MAG: CPBP family intramembrane metalloprotease [Planctomycetes bacterium]|nr:CPBP family intramembrane metalloprotease [Planctomycetota bacterium]
MAIGNPRQRAIVALLLLVPVPSFGTWMAMVQAEGPVGQTIFFAAKLWVCVLPVAWLVLIDKRRPALPLPRRDGMAAAIVSGSLFFLAIAIGYWFLGRHWIEPEFMRDKAHEIGLSTPVLYLLGAVYWCTINSILEEYVWRWFVVTRCEVLMRRVPAVIVSGLLFTLHHIIALNVYFDGRVTALGSLGVFIGGATWSWLYLRYRNIWAAYVSHVFADVIIFIIGWQIIFAAG